jgi:stage IV sporulation protein FB
MLNFSSMLERGSLTLGRLWGIPIRAHWTLPIGALVFSGFRFEPGFWLGFFLLVLIHELGHAFLVKANGLRVVGIDISGFGGLCHWSGYATDRQRGAIAWGGVLAQALLLIVTFGLFMAIGRPSNAFLGELTSVFVYTNVFLIGLNLLPFPPLDGYEAWRFVGRVFRGSRSGKKSRRSEWDERPPSDWGPSARSGESKRAGSDPDPEAARRLARMLERIGDDARRTKR